MMVYPFDVWLSTQAPPEILRVEAEPALPRTVQKELSDYLGRFEMLARSGALCGESISPVLSGLTPGFRKQDSALPREYSDVRIDPGAIYPLLNLLHHFHAHSTAIESVSVFWHDVAAIEGTATIAFPSRTRELSYRLEQDELGRRFDILVEFSIPQPEDVVRRIDDEMGHWFAAASLGAYGDDDFPPPRSAVYYSDDPVELSETSIIWRIEGASCSDGAFDGLINVLEKVSRSLAPLKNVIIGA